MRTALGAGRGRLLGQFMTEGVLLSIVGGALGLLLARVGVQALLRAYPTSLPRTSEVTVDPLVLLFTFGVSIATGLIFGLAPIMHTRVKGLVIALKEGGAKGATGAARHHIRRGLVMAEVALAVMLVIGAGLMLRTVYNLTTVDAGFDRARLVTFSMALPNANYPQAPARAQLYQRLLEKLRGVAGVQGASAMSGLPPNRPLNANDTDIDNYTAPPEGPFENIDYYQSVMSSYFETMGIPIVQGRAFEPSDAASHGLVAVVNETLVNTFWKGQNPIGQRLRPSSGLGDKAPWFTVIGVAKDVKQGGIDQKTGTEVYFFVDQTALAPPPFNFGPGTMNLVLRTTLSPATLRQTVEAAVREVRRVGPGRAAARHERGVRRSDPPAAAARATARRVRRPGVVAGRDRHLRRVVVHGGRTPPRDRHSHGARRRSRQRAGAGDEAGTRPHHRRRHRRARRRLCAQPADRLVVVRRAANGSDDDRRRGRDYHPRRGGRMLDSSLESFASRS